MLTVRFDTGLVLEYNDCHFLGRGQYCHTLRDKEGGRLIATVPVAAVCEFQAPCRIYNQGERLTAARVAEMIEKDDLLRALPGHTLDHAKKQLVKFDRRDWSWKD